MKGLRKILAAASLVMLLVCACAAPANTSQFPADNEQALSAVRQNYRSAALVLRGSCVQLHNSASGGMCADVEVTEVLAGYAKLGDILHCSAENLKQGEEYLLFLGEPEEVHYSEDTAPYSVVAFDEVEASGGALKLKDANVSLSDVRGEIAKLGAVVAAPATSFYYSTLSGIAEAADVVFIGRVSVLPKPVNTYFRSKEGGGTVEQELPASVVEITSFGAVKGALKYGDIVRLIYSPAMSADVVDASTLTVLTYGEAAVPELQEGGVYLFFLMKGPDSKQDFYFPVNPYQGFVAVSDDNIAVPYVNAALTPYRTLTPLVKDIRGLLGL